MKKDGLDWWRGPPGEGKLVVNPKEHWYEMFCPYHYPTLPSLFITPSSSSPSPRCPFLMDGYITVKYILKAYMVIQVVVVVVCLVILKA